VGLTGCGGPFEGFAIGPGDHEDVTREEFLCHDRHQAFRIEADGLEPRLLGHRGKISGLLRIVKVLL
jgi:hypothetical protein